MVLKFINLQTVMHKWLYKIVFILISFSFFVSATELNIGEVHNTFFDEYDTYVKSEQVLLDNITIQQQDTYLFLHDGIFSYRAFSRLSQAVEVACIAFDNSYSSKIFLRNSVWRI